MLAVFHRSSLAVAGLAAADRFDIGASQLATFTMLQLLVYAGMQIPVGLLVDRFGSRSVLLVGAMVLTLAQAGFAFADSYAVALLARLFVGLGDAMTFICVLRLVNTWFFPRQIPVVTQLTGVLGQSGAILAAVPMTWALSHLGWTRSYLLAASFGLVLVVALLVVVHDAPGSRSLRGPAMSLTAIGESLSASWEHPGTRLGFWMHFSTQFSATVLGLLWGYPFFVRGEGRSEAVAGLLLTVMVIAVMTAGPVLGWRVSVRPWHRSNLVLGIVSAIVVVWTVVLVWPGNAPLWLLLVLVVVTGVGGPASMIGFDLGRTSNPVRADGQRHRDHQPGRLPGQPDPRRGGRPDPGLADPGSRERLHPGGLPLGDELPVRALGTGPRADLALPQADPGARAHRGPGLLAAGVDPGTSVAGAAARSRDRSAGE